MKKNSAMALKNLKKKKKKQDEKKSSEDVTHSGAITDSPFTLQQ